MICLNLNELIIAQPLHISFGKNLESANEKINNIHRKVSAAHASSLHSHTHEPLRGVNLYISEKLDITVHKNRYTKCFIIELNEIFHIIRNVAT